MITEPFSIFHYHWVWYTLGFMAAPRLTFMIWLSIYFGSLLPLPLMIIGWICALGGCGITINHRIKK